MTDALDRKHDNPSFLYFVDSFNDKFTETGDLNRIQTLIVRVEGELGDHKTSTTDQ